MPPLYTLYDIQQALPPSQFNTIITSVANGFQNLYKKQVQLAPVVHLGPFDRSGQQFDDACIKAGSIVGEDYFVVKIASGGFSSNLKVNLPTADGLMVVFSQKTGQCEGILLDEGWLTDMRTAAAGAIAAKLLTPKIINNIGVVGTGIQSRCQLKLLKNVLGCRSIILWGRNPSRTLLAKNDIELMGFKVKIVNNIQTLCQESQFIITTTSSTSPLLMNQWIQSGTHISCIGADGIGKQELDPKILTRASIVVCDEIKQCSKFG